MMKVSKELAQVFNQAAKEVENWEVWQRSLDPQGEKSRTTENGEPENYSEEESARALRIRRSA
jgi:hypothetical protein